MNNKRHGMGTTKSIGGYDGEELDKLCHQLKNIAQNFADLLLP
jgi:hypothetical protein